MYSLSLMLNCSDLDPCGRTAPCRNGSTCMNTGTGDYVCLCPEDFLEETASKKKVNEHQGLAINSK